MASTSQSITALLRAWNKGNQQALDELIPFVYAELRRIARQQARRLPSPTLQPSDLIHEAYARLAALEQVAWQDRAHFFAVCAKIMRRLLTDRYRRRLRHPAIALDEAADEVETMLPATNEDLQALDNALTDLEKLHKRQTLIVELRYFGGLTIEEVAALLALSPATVKRDWEQAKRWLRAQLDRKPQ